MRSKEAKAQNFLILPQDLDDKSSKLSKSGKEHLQIYLHGEGQIRRGRKDRGGLCTYPTKTPADPSRLLQHIAQHMAGLPHDEVIGVQPLWAGVEHLEAGRVPERVGGGVCEAQLPEADGQEGVASCRHRELHVFGVRERVCRSEDEEKEGEHTVRTSC